MPTQTTRASTARFSTLLLFGLLLPGMPSGVAQQAPPAAAAGEEEASRESLAVTYREGTTARVKFRGTPRLPGATAEAIVKRRRGITEIDVRLDDMKPAILFGGDYNTYVLWTVSSEGVALNAGEFILRGDRSKLSSSTPLTTFGMFVTAEPHFLVSEPSQFVVLENSSVGLVRGNIVGSSRVQYRGFEGRYEYDQESLVSAPKTEGEFRSERQQSTTALDLAERAGAERWAPEELDRARKAVLNALASFVPGMNEREFAVQARRAVELSVEAQNVALERKQQSKDAAQRKELADLRVAKAEAEAAAARAKEAAERAGRERREAVRAKAEAERATRQARIEQRQARELMQQAQSQTARLSRLKDQAERYANAARSRLQDALRKVVETRETARGVIINLPDILFASGRSRLVPLAREVLSRVAGILLATPDYRLSVEGHTDSSGGANYNQRLSERRAEAVRSYLIESGLSADLMTSLGHGEARPITKNRTPAGRRKNRRVEIVITSTGDSPVFGRR